ncbi:propionate-CoA ligase [Sclerotinia borealis F-4128]|uniref:Propionate-CoA ligase n=1 Tax=Sclerotinia borealis (strain F-4128) TaxID=1432307 RepID=W9C3A3_SCLBF|nr:propionate-CoA ligase [Sclerotinia borealis F-4128]
MPLHPQDEVQSQSLSDPQSFWAKQASRLHWHKPPTQILTEKTKFLKSGTEHKHWEWFEDGEISTCYNCVDRHVLAGNGDETAIIWDSPVTRCKEKISYNQLLREVEVFAGVLREEGVGKGDVVLVYMPMIPAALIGTLAISRLGAIHTVVFGGFAPASLAQRIDASKPVAVLTASCGIDGAKPPISYQPFITEAIALSSHKPDKTIIWQREQLRWENPNKENGERNWQRLVKSASSRGVKADCVPVKSTDGLYIIYTSGTTGLPKGVLREAGGHAVGLNLSISYVFGIHGPGDVMFCASDIGWVVGHSYIIYAPLLAGATTVLFEGKPVGTPNAGTFWRILEEYKVNTLFTAPTALRAIRRDDPENKLFGEIGERGGLKNLRAIFLAGERSEPSIVTMYQELLAKHAAQGSNVIDNWWSSESGSPMTGIALSPQSGISHTSSHQTSAILPVKPGSAGKALPGFDVRVVDDSGNEVPRGTMGNIVLGIPLAPTGFRRLWRDDERFFRGYLMRFGGRWIDTGDAGMVDEGGWVSVMSRSDDIINVAAHRFSTGTIEQAISTHPLITECCVVGIPDALKGHMPFAFITLSTPIHPTSAIPDKGLEREIQGLVRKQIGAIAGKTLRRVLRELLECEYNVDGDGNGDADGDKGKEINIPATIEDESVVGVAREKIREYFVVKRGGNMKEKEVVRAKL